MKVCITLGPSYEPIDQVRCITNFSTGTLGTLLANALTDERHEVTCFRSIMATCSIPLKIKSKNIIPFSTTKVLQQQLQHFAKNNPQPDTFFHIAALSDFMLDSIGDEGRIKDFPGKIASSKDKLTLHFKAAPKLIRNLRTLFPQTKIIGWKYEIDGDLKSCIEKGLSQIKESKTDACVLNGTAYGQGFGLLHPDKQLEPFSDSSSLIERFKLFVTN
ncbi:MAG: phosphopantothenoylcysteine decarboxylase [Verrucomicrobiota bacterium]